MQQDLEHARVRFTPIRFGASSSESSPGDIAEIEREAAKERDKIGQLLQTGRTDAAVFQATRISYAMAKALGYEHPMALKALDEVRRLMQQFPQTRDEIFFDEWE